MAPMKYSQVTLESRRSLTLQKNWRIYINEVTMYSSVNNTWTALISTGKMYFFEGMCSAVVLKKIFFQSDPHKNVKLIFHPQR